MKISELNNFSYKFNFKQSPVNINIGLLTGIDNKVDEFVKNKFENEKKTKSQTLSSLVYDKFTRSYDSAISKIEKFKNPYNKALILNKLAQSYRNNDDVERAGIILAKSFNILKNNLGYWEDDKKKLVENPANFKILKDFFYCSNNNNAKYFVMKSINDLNNPKFLPIAEDICEQDTDITTLNSTKTIREAKKLINKYYNLGILRQYTDKNDFYKIAVINLVNKWGLENNANIIFKLCNDENLQISALAKNAIDNIKRNPNPIPQSEEDMQPKGEYELPVKYGFNLKDVIISKENLKTLKFFKNEYRLKDIITEINESNDITRTIQFIKILGQRGYLSSHAKVVEPNETDLNALTKRKTEAYLKIQVRNNYILNQQ